MGFKVDDELYGKIDSIFDHIQEKLKIDLSDFTFVKKGEEYLKTKVNDETCFKEGKNIFTTKENIKYTCRALFQKQSIFYSMKIMKITKILSSSIIRAMCLQMLF